MGQGLGGRFLIGLVGERGSGKSTVSRLAVDLLKAAGRSVNELRSSDLLRETLGLWRIDATTENLQRLGRAMRDHFGIDAIPNALEQRISSSSDVVIWDGIRWTGDEALLRRSTPSALVYLTAPVETRFRRVRGRREKVEELSMADLSFQTFLAVEQQENEVDIATIGSRADCTIVNDFSEDKELRSRVQEVLRELGLLP